jgi:hypothetical protein
MARRKDTLRRLLKLLNKRRMPQTKIRAALKIDRKTEYRVIKEALQRRWIEKDSLEKYCLTLLGKANISTAADPTDSVSIEAQSQIIDILKLRPERPTARSIIEIENADKIKKLDSQTEAVKRFLTHDGLWLPENNTNLKASVAAVVDSVLDLKAKEMGLFSMLDEEYRKRFTPSNYHIFFPGYDAIKRYEDLAKTKFSILIEFDGSKWASKQDFEDLEKRIEKEREYLSEPIRLIDQRVGFNKAIYGLLSGGDLSTAKLQANHLFNTPEELKGYVINHLKLHQITNENRLNTIIEKAFDTDFFSIEERKLYYLKVSKDNELDFHNSLSLSSPTTHYLLRRNSRTEKDGQKICMVVNTRNIKPILSKELEQFEEAFINQLGRILEKFEAANLSDQLHASSENINKRYKPQLPAIKNSLVQLLYLFHEVLATYLFRSMIIWPTKIKDRNKLNKTYSMAFTKLANIRLLISQRLASFYGGVFNEVFEDYAMTGMYSSTASLLKHVDVFKLLGMEKDSEQLIDAFWDVHKECVQLAFPEAFIYGWDFDYDKDSWKKFLQLQMKYPDQTYANFVKNCSNE